jgi:hypothetical protein
VWSSVNHYVNFIYIYVNNTIYTLKKFEDTKGVLRSLKMKDGSIQWPKKKDKKTNTCGLSNTENIVVNR